jgi:hypothetical protein
MKTSTQTEVENFIDDLFSKGIVGLNYCCTESGEKDIHHYELLESGQEIGKDCFDIGRIPLTSVEGKSVISDHLNDNGIVLYYPLKKSPINFEAVRRFKNIITIEGTVGEVLRFKDQVTDTQGNFNLYDLFNSLIDKEPTSKSIFSDNPTAKQKLGNETQREKFESFWSQSIQGSIASSKKDYFQLVSGYDSDNIPAKNWYLTSLRFPNLMFFVNFYHVNDLYDGTFLFQNGEMYYKTSQSYFKDASGYSICLDKNMTWTYVMHPKAKMQKKARKHVDLSHVVPLQHQMVKIDNPTIFCESFPYEKFTSWYVDEDNYLLPRPNTVIHPDMFPSPYIEREPQADDFDM